VLTTVGNSPGQLPVILQFGANRRRLRRSRARKLTAAITRLPSVLDAPRSALAKLCRKILLDAERDPDAVTRLEASLLSALAEVQSQHGAESISDDDLWEVVREEEKRVADASVLAELLLPKISALLKQRATVQPGPASEQVVPSTEPRPQSPRTSAPLGIADLLEGMLDQQRNETRTRPTTPSRS
jgi:hypothetical protein